MITRKFRKPSAKRSEQMSYELGADSPGHTSTEEESQKRKHKTLSIQEKVQILDLLDAGTPVKRLCNIFNIGSSTVYDIRRKKDALLKFHSERQSKKGVVQRKTMKAGKVGDIERALVQWFQSRRREGISVTGGMIVEQAKILQEQLKTDSECKFSQGWLDKFKSRHGIQLYASEDEKNTSGSELTFVFPETNDDILITGISSEVLDKFIKKFTDTVGNEEFHSEQIYTASQTFLFWRQMPKDLFSAEQAGKSLKSENSEDRIAVFSSYNAAGSHRCKLLVVDKFPKSKRFQQIKNLPVIHRYNERNCVNIEIMLEWLESHFTKEARTHLTSLGFPENCKILLVLDSRLAPSNEEMLVIDNVHLLFIPSDCSAHFQPQMQGISQWLKCWYRLECLTDFLEAIVLGKSLEIFMKEFDIKASIWALARAWEDIREAEFKRSWGKLWPALLYGVPLDSDATDAYVAYRQQTINPIVDHLKSLDSNLTKYICYENLEFWIESGNVVFQEEENSEVATKLNSKGANYGVSGVLEGTSTSVEDCVRIASRLITGLENQSCVGEHEILYLQRLKASLVAEKLKNRKSANKNFKCASIKTEQETPAIKIEEI